MKDVYKCDECPTTFTAEELEQRDPARNIDISPQGLIFVFLNKDGKPTGGTKMPDIELGDKVLACPKCHQVHLFGFNIAEEKAS